MYLEGAPLLTTAVNVGLIFSLLIIIFYFFIPMLALLLRPPHATPLLSSSPWSILYNYSV